MPQFSNQRKLLEQKSILKIILLLALTRGVFYALIVPPWQASDEPAHFERVRAAFSASDWTATSENPPAWYDELRDGLVTFKFSDFITIPTANSPTAPLNQYIGLYQEIYNGLYGSRVSYIFMGLPLIFGPNQPVISQLYWVRINTILMGVGIIVFAYLTTRLIFPDSHFLSLGVPLLILFNPQHTHLLSTLNNGNLAELLVTISLYVAVYGLLHGFSIITVLALLFFSVSAMWTKATAYFMIVPLGLLGLLYMLGRYRHQWRWVSLGSVILAGVVFFLAPARLGLLANEAWRLITAGDFYFNRSVPITIFQSYWGLPGWLTIHLHPFWYQLLVILCGLGLIGLARLVWRQRRLILDFDARIQALLVLAAATGATLGLQLGWHILTGTEAYQQGRTLYPVMVPISIFMLMGWRELVPSAWRLTSLLTITVGLFLFDAFVMFSHIIPFFYVRY
ncbi:MAG: hypothetical protein R3264_01540 [Anaerolineae bacterium]|nr:hypothetical protein [Anaerolineae bacterium]